MWFFSDFLMLFNGSCFHNFQYEGGFNINKVIGGFSFYSVNNWITGFSIVLIAFSMEIFILIFILILPQGKFILLVFSFFNLLLFLVVLIS